MKINISEVQLECLLNRLNESQVRISLDSRLHGMIFVSYGTDKYESSKIRDFKPTSRLSIVRNKPDGGLWASPLVSERSWGDWCSRNAFRLKTLSKHFLFKLNDSARIYVIDTLDDLKSISCSSSELGEPSSYKVINFLYLSRKYDGIFVTAKAARDLHCTYIDDMMGLDSWDVESLCVWNSSVIEPIMEDAFERASVSMYTDNPYGDYDAYDDIDGRKYLQMQNDFMKYGNQNINSDMSTFFNGEHPALLSQLHGNNKRSQQARRFRGDIKSGMK